MKFGKIINYLFFSLILFFGLFATAGLSVDFVEAVAEKEFCQCKYTIIGYNDCKGEKTFDLDLNRTINFKDLIDQTKGVEDKALRSLVCGPKDGERPVGLNEDVIHTISEEWCGRITSSNDRKMIFNYGSQGDFFTTDLVCSKKTKKVENKEEESGACSCKLGDTKDRGIVPDITNREDCIALEGKMFVRINERLSECQWKYEVKEEKSISENFSIPSASSLNQFSGLSIQQVIGKIISTIIVIIGTITLLIFIYGGIMWMTAAGNDERSGKATKIMLWAALGVVVILSSYALVDFIFGSIK